MHDDIAIIDTFTSTPFAGNPAAVCRLGAPRDDAWMQALARELGMPATCFVDDATDGYNLRWFSTAAELALCGHGTLASAHLLLDGEGQQVRFHTAAGVLTCRRDGGWIAMDFPAEQPEPVADPPAALIAALGVEPLAVGRNRLDYLVELDSADDVRGLQPDIPSLLDVQTRGVIVTARSDDPRYDVISRFFAVVLGGAEDQVTGSAHCALGPYWAGRLGRDDITGYQASPRGGVVRMRPRGERIELLGQATTVLRGTLDI
jgi:PhzF family phenazine biosynthesis protein